MSLNGSPGVWLVVVYHPRMKGEKESKSSRLCVPPPHNGQRESKESNVRRSRLCCTSPRPRMKGEKETKRVMSRKSRVRAWKFSSVVTGEWCRNSYLPRMKLYDHFTTG